METLLALAAVPMASHPLSFRLRGILIPRQTFKEGAEPARHRVKPELTRMICIHEHNFSSVLTSQCEAEFICPFGGSNRQKITREPICVLHDIPMQITRLYRIPNSEKEVNPRPRIPFTVGNRNPIAIWTAAVAFQQKLSVILGQ